MSAAKTSTTSLRDPLRWTGHAACLDAPDLPWTHDDPSPSDVAAMAAVCRSCPVRLACAAYATTDGVTGGFWAGQDRDLDRDDTDAEPVRSVAADAGHWETLALPGFETVPAPRRAAGHGVAA